MDGNCFFTGQMPIKQIIDATPARKHAMFRVVSSKDESILGNLVRVTRKGKAFDMISNDVIEGVKAEDLQFLRYIEVD